MPPIHHKILPFFFCHPAPATSHASYHTTDHHIIPLCATCTYITYCMAIPSGGCAAVQRTPLRHTRQTQDTETKTQKNDRLELYNEARDPTHLRASVIAMHYYSELYILLVEVQLQVCVCVGCMCISGQHRKNDAHYSFRVYLLFFEQLPRIEQAVPHITQPADTAVDRITDQKRTNMTTVSNCSSVTRGQRFILLITVYDSVCTMHYSSIAIRV